MFLKEMTEIVLPDKGQIYAVVTKEVALENQTNFLAIAKEFCTLTTQEGKVHIYGAFLLFKQTHHPSLIDILVIY